VARGKLTLPDDDTSADMYTLATNLLAESGYEQYEISNWARESTEKYGSTHNMVYWYNQPYIGLGVGAHSSFGGYRFAVLKHPKDYIKGMREGKSVILTEEAEPITPGLRLADTVFLALRMNEGLPLNRIEQEYGKTIFELFPGVVEKFLGLGLLEAGQNRAGEHVVRLTLRGRLLSNSVFLEFLPE
jgi:oxygen-independent coproporphyrinogen-3 oxidase